MLLIVKPCVTNKIFLTLFRFSINLKPLFKRVQYSFALSAWPNGSASLHQFLIVSIFSYCLFRCPNLLSFYALKKIPFPFSVFPFSIIIVVYCVGVLFSIIRYCCPYASPHLLAQWRHQIWTSHIYDNMAFPIAFSVIYIYIYIKK